MNSQVLNFLASHTYSDATKTTYAYFLEELITQPFEKWGAGDLLQFVKRKTWGESIQYVALCACRSFIRWQCGNSHPALTAKIKKPTMRPQRALKFEQVVELLALFDTYTPLGARDQAIAAVALDTGFRVAELARMKIDDVNFEERTIHAIVKGGQLAYAVFSPETAAILDRWLSYRTPIAKSNALWVSLENNRDRGKQLARESIKKLFSKWGSKMGIKLSPHDCRRTFATVSHMLGAPSRIVQIAGRWSKIEMVERYTQTLEAQAIQPYLPIHHAIKAHSGT